MTKKIALVNVLYPPHAMGGATRVMIDEINMLRQHYADEFEVVVFTADFNNKTLYKLIVEPFEGYRVYRVACGLSNYINWQSQDIKLAEVFNDFLMFEQPDLVHFHCIQALTGSIVETTHKQGIPYCVTVHDAWWISDHQFLYDQFGKVYLDGHPDPFESYTLPQDISLEASVKRRAYLKRLLAGAERVFVVSDTYRRIYEKNGVTNVVTNKNGISDTVNWCPKETRYTEKVVCAHIGSMSKHKGFEIFKDAVKSLASSNIEVLIVDHFKDNQYIEKTIWGVTPVTMIGLVDQEHINELYQRIDVLFAPSICPESFGLVTREAAACGCWVVGSDVGAIGEDITPENGFRISPTTENLQMVLHEIDRAPKKYKGLSKSGYIRHSSDQVQELVDMFNAIFNNRLIQHVK